MEKYRKGQKELHCVSVDLECRQDGTAGNEEEKCQESSVTEEVIRGTTQTVAYTRRGQTCSGT